MEFKKVMEGSVPIHLIFENVSFLGTRYKMNKAWCIACKRITANCKWVESHNQTAMVDSGDCICSKCGNKK